MNKQLILDVRTDAEYQAERVKGSIDIPLSFIENREGRIADILKWKDVLIMCRTWIRAELARQILASHCEIKNMRVFKWWIVEYKKQFPEQIITWTGMSKLPIMRQVQVIAGGLVLLFSILGFLYNVNFFFWSALVGAGLTFAGITGHCWLALVLKNLPFNK